MKAKDLILKLQENPEATVVLADGRATPAIGDIQTTLLDGKLYLTTSGKDL